MEPGQHNFSLTIEINNWQQKIRTGALTDDDIEELTGHLYDEIDELQSKGLSDEEAFMVALKRIGQPVEIEKEYNKLNLSFSNGYNLLMLFWGATIFMLMQTVFFVGPNLPRLIRFKHEHIWYPLDIDLTRTLSYCFCFVAAALTGFNIFKPDKVSAMFSKLIAKYSVLAAIFLVIVGGFASWYNYQTIISNTSYDFFKKDESMLSFQLLAVVFYGSVTFVTAWFTLRYRRKEFRSLKAFFEGFNWLMSLTLGIMLQMVVNLSNIVYIKVEKYTIIIILFSWAGYVIGRSKKYKLNLFMLQVCSFCFCFVVNYYAAHHFFLEMISEYLATLSAIFVGAAISRKKMVDSQAI